MTDMICPHCGDHFDRTEDDMVGEPTLEELDCHWYTIVRRGVCPICGKWFELTRDYKFFGETLDAVEED